MDENKNMDNFIKMIEETTKFLSVINKCLLVLLTILLIVSIFCKQTFNYTVNNNSVEK